MKKVLAAFLLAGTMLTGVANAQPITSPQGNYQTTPYRPVTYSAAFVALAPAASATDFLTITGSATKTVFVRSVSCSGISTAAATATINGVVRSTANTGGTAVTPSATAGGQLVPHDSTASAATAAVAAYTANPTTGTLVGIVRSDKLTTTTAASSAVNGQPLMVWRFGDNQDQSVVLRGATQVFALNGAGASFSAGTALNCSVEWIEQ